MPLLNAKAPIITLSGPLLYSKKLEAMSFTFLLKENDNDYEKAHKHPAWRLDLRRQIIRFRF
jgi:hypothetical protein